MDEGVFGVLVICLLVNGVHGNNNHFSCHGDLCNRGNTDQFCSATFKYCRDCADVVDSCGTTEQPLNCTSFCADYLATLKMESVRVANCPHVPNITNGNVNATNGTKSYYQGYAVEITCNPGYKLESTGRVHCGPFGEFRYESPICEAIRCNPPPPVLNGNILVDSASDEYTVGHNVSYECDGGYSLHGAKSMTCTEDGVWAASDNSAGYSLLCLKDRPNGWMYGFIAITGLLTLFLLLACILIIRRCKQKNKTGRAGLINTFCKWHRKWTLYSNVSTGNKKGKRNISTSSTTECKQAEIIGRNKSLTEAAHGVRPETIDAPDEKQPSKPFYRNTDSFQLLTMTAIPEEKTSGQKASTNYGVRAEKLSVDGGTVPDSMKPDPALKKTLVVQPESATLGVQQCGCACYCGQSRP